MRKLLVHVCTIALLLSPAAVNAAAVSPSVMELNASVGEVIESTFVILNTGVSEQTYFLDRLAFLPSGEDGTPMFIQDTETPFLSWLDFPLTEVDVPANSKVDVPFRVVVPDDIAAGSYWGAITASTAPTDVVTANGATIESKTAVLVFLTVEGQSREKLALLDFMWEQDDASHPYGWLTYRVQNQGNVYLIPEGEIRIVGMFGQTIASLPANESMGRVLPGSTRTFSVAYEKPDQGWLERAGIQFQTLAFGRITAEFALNYGETGAIEAATPPVIVYPFELLEFVGLVLVVILGLMLVARTQFKKIS